MAKMEQTLPIRTPTFVHRTAEKEDPMPPPLTLTEGRLSDALAGQYWDDGYLFPMQVVSPEQAAKWRADLEAIERDCHAKGYSARPS